VSIPLLLWPLLLLLLLLLLLWLLLLLLLLRLCCCLGFCCHCCLPCSDALDAPAAHKDNNNSKVTAMLSLDMRLGTGQQHAQDTRLLFHYSLQTSRRPHSKRLFHRTATPCTSTRVHPSPSSLVVGLVLHPAQVIHRLACHQLLACSNVGCSARVCRQLMREFWHGKVESCSADKEQPYVQNIAS
jgi:hypothetical protein